MAKTLFLPLRRPDPKTHRFRPIPRPYCRRRRRGQVVRMILSLRRRPHGPPRKKQARKMMLCGRYIAPFSPREDELVKAATEGSSISSHETDET